MSIDAGWYPDPAGEAQHRWWDGAQWTSATQNPEDRPPADTASRKPVSLFTAKKRAQEYAEELDRLRAVVERTGLGGVAAADAEVARLRTEATSLRSELGQLSARIGSARAELVETLAQQEQQAVGLYAYHHPAQTSVQLKDELLRLQSEIKERIRDKSAITATANFTFNNSLAQGKKFVADMSRIMLRAYNAEAENCVKTVKAGNLAAASQRLFKAADQIAKQGQMIDLRVTDRYHRLRLRELELAADVHMKVQEEKEAERERREELREQRRVEQELQSARVKLEKELAHYSNAVAALEASGDVVGAERLRITLADTQRALAAVDQRAANTRTGHVYVISNMGAFGINMVKIGMTRRLEPMDRVHELGDASVPFRFDLHALFFAHDAVSVEAEMHRLFADRRVNHVNQRREFFYAHPTEVLAALQTMDGELISYAEEPDAEEYLISIGKRSTSF
ncbi:DUF4041 domain-containing protein [Rhodococcus sp. BP-349]|uniref:DUF4041 domain-containing protein n=1 Tax=unclassified Rhodococcus (in: high G+C Gram-positive bacteria) TaxID=192944 RepID=UPI001C9ACFE8|nr:MULTISPECIES: DUF4041 domain-containing protein [unclassified Rhodococcus (in: high G+C Gram-positive bacteria)]MBY6540308.1 DUF4041 domain-containing protein [Rhodococcus sp. BP-363]MBY6545667.1 DUF4041 domain-containing protein [Rhodococcus sp. BP-369]MBY6564897.1 DUF4041 domain-containing protein [Rhodococcus sp. BP-370]MBY6578167.1 DUF4041 domain-containing protein [Rhodococcus sp. BP-364]MBY6587468.1 DUF4041 domain-containing protein [Rhodococcus sp. BP-358]